MELTHTYNTDQDACSSEVEAEESTCCYIIFRLRIFSSCVGRLV